MHWLYLNKLSYCYKITKAAGLLNCRFRTANMAAQRAGLCQLLSFSYLKLHDCYRQQSGHWLVECLKVASRPTSDIR
jgi:hypothetical protein